MNRSTFFKRSTAIVMMLVTLISVAACGEASGTPKDTKKYATDYNLEVKDTKTVDDNWHIWKREDNGVVMLQIDKGSSYAEEPRDYLLFWVFDTEKQAEDKYQRLYNECKNYNNGTGWQEEGDDWFVSEEPGVCDAFITWMICREGNVIIEADLEISSAWSEGFVEETDGSTTEATTQAATEERFDTWTLKDYVIDNRSALKDYVLNEILK